MKGASLILLIIALERFAWYAMLGEVEVWPQGGSAVIGNLLFAGYLLPLLGGWLGGQFGLRPLCLAGALLLGSGYAAAAASVPALAFGLMALGCGCFKPCLMALLSGSFSGGVDRRRAFSRFYSAIQLGSLLSTPAAALVRHKWGFPAAFTMCAAGAWLAAVVLITSWRKLAPRNEVVEAVLELEESKPVDWPRLLCFLVGAAMFFAGLQQQQTTLVTWVAQVCRAELPETVSTLNPLFCAALLAFPGLARWSNLRMRAAAAGIALAGAFLLLRFAGTSLAWVVGWYALGTLGEALLAPLGMDYVTSSVPRRYASLASALWLLALAAGGKAAGVLGSMALLDAVQVSVFLALGSAVVMWCAIKPR